MTRFRGMQVYHESNKAILCYSQFDLGNRYKIYTKDENGNYRYNISFSSPTESIQYFNRINL